MNEEREHLIKKDDGYNDKKLDTPLSRTIAASLGTVLEWFDFSLFGFLAAEISNAFFPENDHDALIKTFAIFGSAFIMRPIGGMFFGYYADKYGRKKSVYLATVLMTLCTFGMGMLPTYKNVGFFAPLFLLVLRLFQGFSVGGQLVGAIVYTLESAPDNKIGMYSAISLGTSAFGTAFGSIMVTLMHLYVKEEVMKQYGWRIPFFVGLIVGLVGLYFFKNIGESPIFQDLVSDKRIEKNSPVSKVLREELKRIILLAVTISIWPATYYIGFIWLPTFLIVLRPSPITPSSIAFLFNSIASLFLCCVVMPFGGYLYDEKGYKDVSLMLTGTLSIIILSPFIFGAMMNSSILIIAVLQLILALPLGLYGALLPKFMIDMFLPPVRTSGIGIAYNLSHALFGISPFLATLLYKHFLHCVYVGVFLSVVGLCSLICLHIIQKYKVATF